MHPAHRTIGVTGGLAALPAYEEFVLPAPQQASRPPAVCLVLLHGPRNLEDWQVPCLGRHVRQGGSLLVLDAAGSGRPAWAAFARDVLGSPLHRSFDVGAVVARPVAAAARHPILSGVRPFTAHVALGQAGRLAAATTALLIGGRGDRAAPLAWTREDRGGRIFATILGAAEDFAAPEFLRLIANAVAWANENVGQAPRA